MLRAISPLPAHLTGNGEPTKLAAFLSRNMLLLLLITGLAAVEPLEASSQLQSRIDFDPSSYHTKKTFVPYYRCNFVYSNENNAVLDEEKLAATTHYALFLASTKPFACEPRDSALCSDTAMNYLAPSRIECTRIENGGHWRCRAQDVTWLFGHMSVFMDCISESHRAHASLFNCPHKSFTDGECFVVISWGHSVHNILVSIVCVAIVFFLITFFIVLLHFANWEKTLFMKHIKRR